MARVEKETRKKLKCLSLEKVGEFISNKFNEFCTEKGIKRKVSAPVIPQQNDIPERRNKSTMDCARTLMIEKNVTIKYWKEAINILVHTLKKVQMKKESN